MTIYGLSGGIRKIPAALLAQGQCYSTALHSILGHNQTLIANGIVSRQLINDYYPSSSGVAHGELSTPRGAMIAQWGRFEHQPGMMITARAWAAMNNGTYADETYLRLISTPMLLNPNTPISKLVTSYQDTLFHAVETVDSTSYSYYSFTVLPNSQMGGSFYLSLWKQSADPGRADNSEIYLRFFNAYEEPEIE